jgi:hypothetical protein
MDDYSKPKATLVIKVCEHETLTGADGEQHLDFDDSVNAVNGLIGWLARSLAEVTEGDRKRIGEEILVAALYGWAFNQSKDAPDESDEDDFDDDDLDEDDFDNDGLDEDEPDEDEPDEDDFEEYPSN